MNITNSISQQHSVRLNSSVNANKQVKLNCGHSNISFGSSKSEGILKLLDGQITELINGNSLNMGNRMRFSKILKEALPHVMTEENFMNAGRDSKVYRISDNYVAKIRRGHYEDDAIGRFSTLSIPNRKFKDLDFYYGEPLAKLGNVEILKNATPSKNDIYCGFRFFREPGVSYEDEMKRYKTVYLPACSSLPQESFDNLAENLKKLNEKRSFGINVICRYDKIGRRSFLHVPGIQYYTPDFLNANNFIISDGKFKLVDKMETVGCKNPNSLYTMLEPLLIRLGPYTSAADFAYFDPELVDMRAEIYNKCLEAAKKVNLPADSPMTYEFAEYYLLKLLPPRI